VLESIDGVYGVEDHVLVAKKSVGGYDVIVVESADKLYLLPVILVGGDPERLGTLGVFAYLMSPENVGAGDKLSLGGLKVVVHGYFLGPTLVIEQPFIAKALLAVNSTWVWNELGGGGWFFYLFVKTSRGCEADLGGVSEVARETSVRLLREAGLSNETLIELLLRNARAVTVDCIPVIAEEDRKLFEEEYGSGSACGIVFFGSLIVFLAYIMRIAMTDVGERMRDIIALAYALGASNAQVARMIAVQALVYIVPALALALVINYAYLRFSVQAYFPFTILLDWFSPLVLLSIVVAIVMAVITGLYSVRRKPLSEVLSGG
jgi:hypothetical protein